MGKFRGFLVFFVYASLLAIWSANFIDLFLLWSAKQAAIKSLQAVQGTQNIRRENNVWRIWPKSQRCRYQHEFAQCRKSNRVSVDTNIQRCSSARLPFGMCGRLPGEFSAGEACSEKRSSKANADREVEIFGSARKRRSARRDVPDHSQDL